MHTCTQITWSCSCLYTDHMIMLLECMHTCKQWAKEMFMIVSDIVWFVYMYMHVLLVQEMPYQCLTWYDSLVPRLSGNCAGEEKKEPGLHCMPMHNLTQPTDDVNGEMSSSIGNRIQGRYYDHHRSTALTIAFPKFLIYKEWQHLIGTTLTNCVNSTCVIHNCTCIVMM